MNNFKYNSDKGTIDLNTDGDINWNVMGGTILGKSSVQAPTSPSINQKLFELAKLAATFGSRMYKLSPYSEKEIMNVAKELGKVYTTGEMVDEAIKIFMTKSDNEINSNVFDMARKITGKVIEDDEALIKAIGSLTSDTLTDKLNDLVISTDLQKENKPSTEVKVSSTALNLAQKLNHFEALYQGGSSDLDVVERAKDLEILYPTQEELDEQLKLINKKFNEEREIDNIIMDMVATDLIELSSTDTAEDEVKKIDSVKSRLKVAGEIEKIKQDIKTIQERQDKEWAEKEAKRKEDYTFSAPPTKPAPGTPSMLGSKIKPDEDEWVDNWQKAAKEIGKEEYAKGVMEDIAFDQDVKHLKTLIKTVENLTVERNKMKDQIISRIKNGSFASYDNIDKDRKKRIEEFYNLVAEEKDIQINQLQKLSLPKDNNITWKKVEDSLEYKMYEYNNPSTTNTILNSSTNNQVEMSFDTLEDMCQAIQKVGGIGPEKKHYNRQLAMMYRMDDKLLDDIKEYTKVFGAAPITQSNYEKFSAFIEKLNSISYNAYNNTYSRPVNEIVYYLQIFDIIEHTELNEQASLCLYWSHQHLSAFREYLFAIVELGSENITDAHRGRIKLSLAEINAEADHNRQKQEQAPDLKKAHDAIEKSIKAHKDQLQTPQLEKEIIQAGYRVAATQITSGSQALILKAFPEDKLPAVQDFLNNQLGNSLISMMLGMGITYGMKENPKAQKLAEELRINSLTTLGNTAAEELMGMITEVMTKSLSEMDNTPALEEVKMSEEEQDLILNETAQTIEENIDNLDKASGGAN